MNKVGTERTRTRRPSLYLATGHAIEMRENLGHDLFVTAKLRHVSARRGTSSQQLSQMLGCYNVEP